jgi:hypothetical protein
MRRLWQSLVLANLVGIVCIALPAWVVHSLGARHNDIVVAARYIWVALAWISVALGLIWGKRSSAALRASGTYHQRGFFFPDVLGCCAFFILPLFAERYFVTDKDIWWNIPYEVAGFFFDAYTMDLASDECLAFRAVDDVRSYGPLYPGMTAEALLVEGGSAAVPGIAAFVGDRLANPRGAGHGRVTIQLLALLAAQGDHPLLKAFDWPNSDVRELRACIHSGHRVVVTPGYHWSCKS